MTIVLKVFLRSKSLWQLTWLVVHISHYFIILIKLSTSLALGVGFAKKIIYSKIIKKMLCKKTKGNSIIIRIMIPNRCDKNIRDLTKKNIKKILKPHLSLESHYYI